MYPGSIFRWHNMSQINPAEPASVDNSPLYLHLSSFEKGPEEMTIVKGEDFYKLYGTKMNFAANGQPAIQAANIIDKGGRLLVKRLVAKDATLANVIAIATVKTDVEATKVSENNIEGKTLEEILTGEVPEEKVYADVLSLSSIPKKAGKTLLKVNTAVGEGNFVLWKESSSDILPELGTEIEHSEKDGLVSFADWNIFSANISTEDGQANPYNTTKEDNVAEGAEDRLDVLRNRVIAVADETKIAVVEYSLEEGIQKFGTITTASGIPHPGTVGSVPDNHITALIVTSSEGEQEGHTVINFGMAPGKYCEYYYKVIDSPNDDGTLGFPDQDEILEICVEEKEPTEGHDKWEGWTEISTQKNDSSKRSFDLTIPDGTQIMIIRVEPEKEKSNAEELEGAEKYEPAEESDGNGPQDGDNICQMKVVAGCSIFVCSKLPFDKRWYNSTTPVTPTTDLYVVNTMSHSIKWNALTVENCKTYDEVLEVAKSLYKEAEPTIEAIGEAAEGEDVSEDDNVSTGVKCSIGYDFPILVITDNGRGISNKAFKITADPTTSKDMSNMMYIASVFEGTTGIDSIMCALSSGVVIGKTLYTLDVEAMTQTVTGIVPGMFDNYMSYLGELLNIEEAELRKCDLINLKTNRGAALEGITIDPESIDFGADYGVPLQSGNNGEFGDAPFGTDAYIEAACAFIDEECKLWDPDTYKIFGIFDANYPEPVKDKLAWYATNREDTMFFRDYGLDVFSYGSIFEKCNSINPDYKNYFNSEYYTTYEIYDPETRVRERVTMMYDFAASMVDHFARGAYRPAAGIVNGMILPSAIDGTINFIPYVMPQTNQKALIDDMRVNYALFQDGQCVVQSTYTADEDYSQCSYLNNILAVEEVIRAVRTACPKQRFRFVTNNDFSVYADAVNNVLKNFRSNFAYLKFEYTSDPLKAAQKIFNAGIYFKFNNWEQTEYFDLYCLGDDDEV